MGLTYWWRVTSSLRSRLVRGGLSGLTVRVLAIVMGFLSSVVIVRLLGAEEYGRFAFALTIVTFLVMPSTLGLPTLIVREIAGGEATKDWGRIRGIIIWSRRVVFGSSLALCGAAAALIQTNLISIDAELKPALLLALLVVPLLAFAQTIDATLRGVHRVFWGQFPDAVLRPTLMMLGVAAIYYTVGRSVTAFETIGLMILVLMGVVVLGIILVRAYMPAEVTRATPSYVGMDWARTLIPLSFITGLQTLYNNTDLLLIGIMVDTTSVGTYRIALSISNVATFGIMATNLVVMPYYANLHKTGDWAQIWKISRYAGLATFALCGSMTAILFLFGQPLISFVYGVEHINAYWPAVVLSLGLSVYGIWASIGGVAMMTGREDRFMKILVGSVSANAILNIILIPYYQINGAAVASAISFSLNGLFLWMSTQRLAQEAEMDKR